MCSSIKSVWDASHNTVSILPGGVTSSSRYTGRFRRLRLCVVGFAGGVAGGLEVEEFYDFVGVTEACFGRMRMRVGKRPIHPCIAARSNSAAGGIARRVNEDISVDQSGVD